MLLWSRTDKSSTLLSIVTKWLMLDMERDFLGVDKFNICMNVSLCQELGVRKCDNCNWLKL